MYEHGRPGYPAQALDPLEITERSIVADLGCGTGKFTRLLTTSGASVVGIEPLAPMAETFRALCPGVPIAAGTAESIPFAPTTFDVVACASAFHWFRHDLALPEIHRVLKSGGRLGVIWNRRDRIEGWAAEFWAITEEHRGDTPGYRTGAWREALDSSELFGPISEHWFDHVQRVDLNGLLARVSSISFIDVLPTSEREAVLARAERFVRSHEDTKDLDVFELPYRTAVYVTRRVG